MWQAFDAGAFSPASTVVAKGNFGYSTDEIGRLNEHLQSQCPFENKTLFTNVLTELESFINLATDHSMPDQAITFAAAQLAAAYREASVKLASISNPAEKKFFESALQYSKNSLAKHDIKKVPGLETILDNLNPRSTLRV